MANKVIKETEQVIDQGIVMVLFIDRVMGLLLIGVTMLIIFRVVLIARNISLLHPQGSYPQNCQQWLGNGNRQPYAPQLHDRRQSKGQREE